jgi:long-chain fatty acid transport protein
MTIKTLASTTAILAVGASTAFAGGLDRSTFSSNILFEEGTYAEVVYGITSPKVRSVASPVSIATSFNTVKLGFKMDVTKKIAVALTYNNQPVGADINYTTATGGAIPLAGAVNAQQLTLLGKYQFTDQISAFGGVKYQYINGSVDLTAAAGTRLVMNGESEYGYIGGVAYEIPDIKLRVALSYESKIDYSFGTRFAAGGGVIGQTTAATAEAWNLEFQSGVAANTLVFGSIRYAKWADAQINVLGTVITSNTNVTSYELGVARRFNDAFVGFFAIGYEAPEDTPQGAFAPTDGQFDIKFGGQASLGKGVKLGASIKYSRHGDAIVPTLGPAGSFNDPSVLTVGFKLSKNF